MVRVKICGITSVKDALFAEMAGADAIGVVMSDESKRDVTPAQAKKIFESLGPFISKVVVTHTKSQEKLNEIISLNPTAIQISTDIKIPDNYVGDLIRVVKSGESIPNDCDAVIIDDSRGEGIKYNPDFSKKTVKISDIPVILAGGLTPENVAEAISGIKPYAVDVCSGVELNLGEKDNFKVLEFLRACGKIPEVRRKRRN
ncbi:phosphoribosylanthranilate isomerase [Methanoplanus sp. FWC-SCC4]|uniref:N-(5'-phosphoribosyl)anthranilate isomerase n=1 Tax=Methanochimaera problematica TaxID=2609417 RepID=A0AA97FAS4_9EURY|nr:phosphoribosylanthranilate isomerase [Methanoplanus sp. FWC-SCC4]WOF15935.1 phosphoribosylanthranilate isomerase [Methanoplanus sp. FWC-SCC4]